MSFTSLSFHKSLADYSYVLYGYGAIVKRIVQAVVSVCRTATSKQVPKHLLVCLPDNCVCVNVFMEALIFSLLVLFF